MAFTLIQIANALQLNAKESGPEIHTNLAQARDILLRKKQRFTLGAVDESHLKTVQDLLRDIDAR